MSGESMDYKPVLIGGLAVVLLLELVGFFIEIPWYAGLMLAVGIFGLIGYLLGQNYPFWEIAKIVSVIALVRVIFLMAGLYFIYGNDIQLLGPAFIFGMVIFALVIANLSAFVGCKYALSISKQKPL